MNAKQLLILAWVLIVSSAIANGVFGQQPGVSLVGSDSSEVGTPTIVRVTGLPEPDMTKPLGESFAWLQDVQIELSTPENSESTIQSGIGLNIAPLSWRLELTFTPDVQGTYVVAYAYHGEPKVLQVYRVQVGATDPTDPLEPNQTVTAVTYVFEKDRNAVPSGVATALQKINQQQPTLLATEFEQDTVNGMGEVPIQYRAAKQAALKNGLPCLVIQAGSSVVSVVDDPQTEADVMEALKWDE